MEHVTLARRNAFSCTYEWIFYWHGTPQRRVITGLRKQSRGCREGSFFGRLFFLDSINDGIDRFEPFRELWFSYRLPQESIRNKISATRVDSLPVICYIRWLSMAAFVEIVKLSMTSFHELHGYHSIETRSKYRGTSRYLSKFSEIWFGPICGLILSIDLISQLCFILC